MIALLLVYLDLTEPAWSKGKKSSDQVAASIQIHLKDLSTRTIGGSLALYAYIKQQMAAMTDLLSSI